MELNKLCRTCLSTAENLQSLYETCASSTLTSCAEMLSTFTPLICFRTDGFPTNICSNCIGELNRFNAFRLKCLESDTTLRNYLDKDVKTDEIVNKSKDNRIFEEVSVKCEYSDIQQNTITTKSLKEPLTFAEIHKDLNQKLDLIKHELNVDIKIEKDDAINNATKKEKPYSCTECTNTYRQNQTLQIHLLTHTGEKPYPCTVCDSSFRTKQHLKIHLRTHTEERPYSCTLCSNSFRQKHNLVVHMRIHTDEKPFSCTVCNSSFKQKQHLTYHMRKHTGETPYPCTVCKHSFVQPQSLKFHMRTHTGEKPYPCTVCDSSFKHKHHLKNHMRKHTEMNA